MEYKGYKINKEFEELGVVKKGKKVYLEKYVCLDTETSWNHDEENPECWIYQWAFTFNKGLYYGRKPLDLIDKLDELVNYYQQKIVVFVHNLPYDFSYLEMFLYKCWGNPKNVLAYQNHKCFLVEYENGVEFRCTYKLSNDSLDRWSKKLSTTHKKLVGAIDYDVIRYQNSPLYKNDWKYMFGDAIVLDEAVEKQMLLYSDNIATIPLTSTGYTRREILESYRPAGKHKYISKDMRQFKSTALDVETYKVARKEFSGGITHGNRFYQGRKITLETKENMPYIKHRDFRSHYPSQQRVQLFPMGKFIQYSDQIKLADLAPLLRKYAVLIEVDIADVVVKDHITMPYMQTSHVVEKVSENFKFIDDNGRILYYRGTARHYLDLNEFLLIKEQYDFEFVIRKSYISKLGPLPLWLTRVIDKNFKGKTDFKDIVKMLEENNGDLMEILDAEQNLMKSKNVVNGIYGVSGTDPVRQEITLTENVWETHKVTEKDIEDQLNKYYQSYSHYMRYQWGVYTTIYARLELMYFLSEIIGYENFIYCDTDSIFYFSNDEIEARIEAENERLYKESIEKHAYVVSDKGKTIVYNQFELEKEEIEEFKFLHSKCYCYVTEGKLKVTVAGVQKYNRETNTTNAQELGSIDNFEDGFTFTKCGGTKAKYVSSDMHLYKSNQVAGGCIITKTTKTLSCNLIDDTDLIMFADNYYN